MTTPTAADFAAARFAEHPDGNIAARLDPADGEGWVWHSIDDIVYSDAGMADAGWRIVTPAPDLSDPDVIERAADRARIAYRYLRETPWEALSVEGRNRWADAVRAALTLPPARDPKVDELKAILVDFWTEASDDDWTEEECAVYLASRGVRVEGGEG